jgi:hypothetical protein
MVTVSLPPGILFGKMVLELGDTCVAKNDVTEYTCDLDFKTKVCVSLPPHNHYLTLEL